MPGVLTLLLTSALLLAVSGSAEPIQRLIKTKTPKTNFNNPHRKLREIRKGGRDGRLVYQTSEETFDQRKGLIFHNRPGEPLHDLYRKGFSHLHVPDFHRLAVEERAPLRPNGGNQSIDDIISGIIHLLGGDVHVTRPGTKLPSVIFTSSPRPTRINNRGPAHFDKNRPLGINRTNEILPSKSSVIENSHTESFDNKIVIPHATDVSLILGLLNDTFPEQSNKTVDNNFIGGMSNVSSGDLEIVEIIPSDSGSRYRLPSTSSTKNIAKAATQSSGQIRPTEVLTELDKNGHTFIETVVRNDLFNFSSAGNNTVNPMDSNTNITVARTENNYTDLPIILPSRHVPSTNNGEDITPSGPITEWLPIPKPSERGQNSTGTYKPSPQEPVIITRPPVDGPDNFEVTVTRQMYSNQSSLTEKAITTFTSLVTPTDVISSTDISVSIVNTQVDVIYGRPSMSVLPPPPPTGRPQVYPVDIEKVRPSPRPNVYQRQRPSVDYGLQKSSSGLRPIQRPRTSTGTMVRKPPAFRPQPPQLPEIRIDTCVVGDDSTCDVQLKEHCRTERGVSSCLCRPGYGRLAERSLCSPVVSMLLTLKAAKLADKSIDPTHFVPGSAEYQRLNFEASQAVSTLFGFSPLSDAYRGAVVNRIYFIANRMVINSTVHLAESEVRGSLRHHVEHAVATAIGRRDSRLGTSQLYVNGPLSALVEVEDLNECGDNVLNDCSEYALCDNLFGSFQCKCKPGYTDKLAGDPRNEGRICSACSPDYCNGKGQCVIIQGRQECRCRGNYGGSRCQVDNEVVGVSVGVSVIAIIVIAITVACLYLWNRRWKRAHQKSEAAKQHTGYRLQTMADHVRWGATSPIGSTYVPSESTMQLAPRPLSSNAGQLYAISTIQPPRRLLHRSQMYEEDINPYGRIIRTLQKHNSLNNSAGMHYDTLDSECPSSEEIGFPSVPSNSFVYHGTFPDRKIYR